MRKPGENRSGICTLDVKRLPSGDHKPIELCRKLAVLRRWREESAMSQKRFAGLSLSVVVGVSPALWGAGGVGSAGLAEGEYRREWAVPGEGPFDCASPCWSRVGNPAPRPFERENK